MTRDELKAKVGEVVGTSRWFLIDQPRIDAFAEITEDPQFIHIDPERAKAETPFGGTIAHGFLTLSMLSAMTIDAVPLLEGTRMSVNYGCEKVRFLSPVPSGGEIRGVFTLKEFRDEKPGEITTVMAVSVEIKGSDRPALYAEWIGRQYYGEDAA